eukprot:4493463-Prymnesium_polylepis.1
MISSSSPLRCATVPIFSSAFDDQRVEYCVQPRSSVRISICKRGYSSCCASAFGGRFPPACGGSV